MRKGGRIKAWHADKGYGFIEIHAQSKDVFFHISALQGRAIAPKVGDRVSFELSAGKDGRPQASQVSIAGAPGQAGPDGRANLLPALVAAFALLAIFAASLAGRLPRGVALASLGLSVAAFARYAVDKRRAVRSEQRIPENELHLLALCGGWPGALAAQHLLRHKNRKASFQATFWATVLLNVGAMVLWATVLDA